MSGVASFSPYRSSRPTHLIGASSPRSATSARPSAVIGSNGSSKISGPSSTGACSSSSPISPRIIRDFACPRSPRKITSCPASSAFCSAGTTLSS